MKNNCKGNQKFCVWHFPWFQRELEKGIHSKRGREIGRKREIQTEKKRGKVRKRKEEITEKMSEMLMCEKERK